MKESDLYIPVRDWLLRQGYTIHVEIFNADIVAMKPDPTCHRGIKIVAVELKPCLTKTLYSQLGDRSRWADEVWGAIASEPRGTAGYRFQGYGLLRVIGGKVKMLRKALPQPWYRNKMRNYRIKKLGKTPTATESCRAGLPSCRELAEQRVAARAEVAHA